MVDAGLAGASQVEVVGRRGENHNATGAEAGAGAQPFENLKTVDPGHLDIQEQQVRRSGVRPKRLGGLQVLDSLLPVADIIDEDSWKPFLKGALEEQRISRVVFSHKHAQGFRHKSSMTENAHTAKVIAQHRDLPQSFVWPERRTAPAG